MRIFPIPDPGSRVKKIPRSRISVKKNLSIFIQKVASNLSEILSGISSGIRILIFTHPGSRDQKVTGSRIRIRNTAGNRFCVVTTNLGNRWLCTYLVFPRLPSRKIRIPENPRFVFPCLYISDYFSTSPSNFAVPSAPSETVLWIRNDVLWIRPFLSIRIRIRLWIRPVEKDSRGINPLPM